MKVIGVEKSDTATVLYLDKDDGQTHVHVIPDGIIEDRMESWDLDNREEALDLILVQSHEDPDNQIPNRFEVEDLAEAKTKLKNVVGNKSKNIKYATGISRKQICDKAKIDPDTEQAVRQMIRHELQAAAHVKTVGRQESLVRQRHARSDVAVGFERRAEELIADEIVSDNPELKKAPRIRDEETVESVVKFI
jgi:hypothetical protein